MKRPGVEQMAELGEVPVRPASFCVIRDHEPDLEFTGYVVKTRGSIGHSTRGDIVGPERNPLVQERRDVLLPHWIHRAERQLYLAGGGVHHRRDVGVEALHATR